MSTDPHDIGKCECCEYSTYDWSSCTSCQTVYCYVCAKYELKEVDDEKLCKGCLEEVNEPER